MVKLLSLGKAAPSSSLAIRESCLSKISLGKCSPHTQPFWLGRGEPPDSLRALARSPGSREGLVVAVGTGEGALMALLPSPYGITSSLSALPIVPCSTRD